MTSLKLTLIILIVIVLSACGRQPPGPAATPTPEPTPTPEWILVWSDEFDLPDGSPPDPNFWNHSTGGTGWGNAEIQYYSDRIENAFIEDGRLVIRAIEEDYMGLKYSSARINSMVKAEFQYGRFEARAKLPNTQGIWPAIWMMPTIARYGTWPASGEIDIMEMIGSEPSTVHGTLHYGNPHEYKTGTYVLPNGETLDQDFHIFAVEWEPDQIRWYIDGIQYHQVDAWFTSHSTASELAPFDQPFHLILNVAVGGRWPGYPDENSVFPQEMIVDYIRVYQKEIPGN
jgi:beta-glucanase (GH16 family)